MKLSDLNMLYPLILNGIAKMEKLQLIGFLQFRLRQILKTSLAIRTRYSCTR